MRNRCFFVFLMICVVYGFVYGEKVAALPDVLRPFSLEVNGNDIYIVDNDVIRLFSLKDYKYVKQISKKGAGPGECPFSPNIRAYPDSLFVNTWGKVLRFSRSGELKEEKKLAFPIKYFIYPLVPVGENFVGPESSPGKNTISIKIFDKNLNGIKEISNGLPQYIPLPPRPGEKKVDYDVIGDCWNYVAYNKRIYLSDTRKGFHFSVFNSSGKKLYEINNKYEKLGISDNFKEDYMKRLRAHSNWEMYKKSYNFIFKKYFPAFASFKVINDKIYAYTFNKKGNNYEIIVMDLKGNILKRAFPGPLFPNTERFMNWYSIYDDKLYYLAENEKDEIWELHIVKINE